MARTIAQIQQALITAKAADPTLGPALTNTSKTAKWLLWTYILAVCQWTLETLFDTHAAEMQTLITNQKRLSTTWYSQMALKFQYGDTLPPDTDTYNPVRNPGDPAFIITAAACQEIDNLLRLKVATGTPGALTAISAPQLSALEAYIGRLKGAGVDMECTSGVADTLQAELIIFYDPLVLTSTGARIDGSSATPVVSAVNTFLQTIALQEVTPNVIGRFIVEQFINAILAVQGVIVVEDVNVHAFYASTPPVVVDTWYDPDAGYLSLDMTYWNANVTYQPYTS